MSFLLLILVVQAAAVIGVMFVLKGVLNNMLVDLAVRHLEFYRPADEPKKIEKVQFVSHKPLKKILMDRARHAVQKNFSSAVTLEFSVEKNIWGGAVVRLGEQVLDFSLRDRMIRAFQRG